MKTLEIDIENTINSGQVFLWEKINKTWYGINGSEILKFKHDSSSIIEEDIEFKFFRFDDDTKKILKSITKDKIVKEAVSQFPGLRLLRQDPFQCFISFICSSNSSIQNIKQMLKNICRKFGNKVLLEGNEFYTFPTEKILANCKISDLLSCGLGFRSKYVKKASMDIISGKIDFDFLKKANYYESKNKLLEVFGIGNKIADCVLLFSLEKTESFPLDRWTLRILLKYYPDRFGKIIGKSITEKKYEILHDEIVNYFGEYAGYAQQFLFKMERDLNHKKWL